MAPPRPQAGLSPRRFEQILIGLTVGALLIGAVWALRGNWAAPIISITIGLLTGVLYLLSRRGYSRVASQLVVAGLNLAVIMGVSFFGGPKAHAPAFLLSVVMLSGLMVGWRGGAASLGACALSLALDGFYGPAPWAFGTIANTPGAVTVDWLLSLGLAGGLGIVAFHTTSRLIAEARSSETAKEEALARAEMANHAKSAFLANMSHELRTPLTAILGYGELLEEDLDDAHRDDIRKINRAGRHLLGLIDDVLDMSRIEAGRLELQAEPVDLDALVDDVFSLLMPTARAADVELRRQGARAGTGRSDRLRLRQIIVNLLSNAIKYAPGRPVDLHVARDAASLTVTVADHGAGIPEAVLPTLFEPFSRGHGTEVDGTGLGLALSHALAQGLGGQLTVASSPTGARFTLTVPFPEDRDVSTAR